MKFDCKKITQCGMSEITASMIMIYCETTWYRINKKRSRKINRGKRIFLKKLKRKLKLKAER